MHLGRLRLWFVTKAAKIRVFHAHIAENDTRTLYFIKEINFIKQNWRKLRMKIIDLKSSLQGQKS